MSRDSATTHTVAVKEFEGPLGLLLELVERGQLAITEISVGAITAQYLQGVEKLKHQPPENLSEFLQLGARLVYIKSLALLPREAGQEQAEELRQLNLELAEYRRFVQAARHLAGRPGSSWARPGVLKLPRHELPAPNVTLAQLSEAFERALRQTQPVLKQGIIHRQITQAEVTRRLQKRLHKGGFELQELLDGLRDRVEIIVTFLALLELMRDGRLRVVQAGQFQPIMVEAAHG